MQHSLMLHFQIKGDLERGGGMPADKKCPVLNEVVTFFPWQELTLIKDL